MGFYAQPLEISRFAFLAGCPSSSSSLNWKRDWWRVTQALLPVIEQGKLDNRPMTDCIYLVPERNPKRIPAIERAWDNFRLTLIARDGAARLGVVLGEATLMEKSQFGYKLSLLHFPPFLYFSEGL